MNNKDSLPIIPKNSCIKRKMFSLKKNDTGCAQLNNLTVRMGKLPEKNLGQYTSDWMLERSVSP